MKQSTRVQILILTHDSLEATKRRRVCIRSVTLNCMHAEKWAEDPENAVAKWAQDQVRYIKTRIEEARKREEESGF